LTIKIRLALNSLLLLQLTVLEGQYIPKGMSNFLPDLSLSEFNQLAIFQFEKSGSDGMLKGVNE
jgi:hypothetical protein